MGTNGDLWQEQRRFSLHVLRNFGLGRNEMEIRIMHETDKMITWMNELIVKVCVCVCVCVCVKYQIEL